MVVRVVVSVGGRIGFPPRRHEYLSFPSFFSYVSASKLYTYDGPSVFVGHEQLVSG